MIQLNIKETRWRMRNGNADIKQNIALLLRNDNKNIVQTPEKLNEVIEINDIKNILLG